MGQCIFGRGFFLGPVHRLPIRFHPFWLLVRLTDMVGRQSRVIVSLGRVRFLPEVFLWLYSFVLSLRFPGIAVAESHTVVTEL